MQQASIMKNYATMAYNKVSLKLLIDKKNHKVLFAEAGKDFVDFLFNILSLPLASVIKLLKKKDMVGCVANLYESIERLSQDYIQPNQVKATLLKPTVSTLISRVPLLTLTDHTTPAAAAKKFYKCESRSRSSCSNYVTDDGRAVCPSCGYQMSSSMTYVAAPAGGGVNKVAVDEGGGFVKGVVTYMVMDDLVVAPMSTISGITLLNKFNVRDVGVLDEMVVDLGVEEGLMLLKASLKGKTALTTVFLGKI